MTTPVKTERNITIARDASDFQKRNEIATGIAFCTEKTVTNVMIINTIINVIIFPLVVFHLLPFLSRKSTEDRGEDNKLKARISGIIPLCILYLFSSTFKTESVRRAVDILAGARRIRSAILLI